jgi:hypothetical protein
MSEQKQLSVVPNDQLAARATELADALHCRTDWQARSLQQHLRSYAGALVRQATKDAVGEEAA